MFRLTLKNSGFYALFLALFIPGLFWYWNSTRTAIDATMVTVQISMMITGAFLAILNCELAEEKNKGYRFLETLPLTAREIVMSKFLPLPLYLVIFSVFSWWFFSRVGSDAGSADLAHRILAVSASACLPAGAAVYLGFFRFGFDRFYKVLVLLLVLSYLSPIVVDELLIPAGASFPSSVPDALSGRGVLVAVFFSLAAWCAMMPAAIALKKGKDERTD